MRWLAGGLACAVGLAGCFGPEAREGLRCSANGDCPPGQDCYPVAGGPQPGVCSSTPPVDDGGTAFDAGSLAFGTPEPVELLCGGGACSSPRDPSLTEDRKQIVFTIPTLNAVGDLDVYLAIRPTAFDPWFPAQQAGAIDTLDVEEAGWMSGDGLRLYFSRTDQDVSGPPYGELWVSDRLAPGDPFDVASPVAGVVNTSRGSERSAARTEDASRLLFTRALEEDLADHDVYVALASGGQWDSVGRVDGVSTAGADDLSLAVADGNENMLFVGRGERILEARWPGGYVVGAELVSEHDELVVAGADRISGIWVSPDGGEIWFGACGATCTIYRAVR